MSTYTQWQRWMLLAEVESHGGRYDRATGLQDARMVFRFPSDPGAFWGFMGEQVRSCVYRPTAVFLEAFLEGIGDEYSEPDPESFEVYNVTEACEGLDGMRVGYHFRLRFRWRDRYGEVG